MTPLTSLPRRRPSRRSRLAADVNRPRRSGSVTGGLADGDDDDGAAGGVEAGEGQQSWRGIDGLAWSLSKLFSPPLSLSLSLSLSPLLSTLSPPPCANYLHITRSGVLSTPNSLPSSLR